MLIIGTAMVRAEEAPVAHPLSEASQLDADYILGTGDEIIVEDVNMGRLTESPARILADGTVDLPLAGMVHLEGMPLDQAQALLNEKYARYYVNPAVTILVSYMHPIRFYVQGAVTRPGVFLSGKNMNPADATTLELGAASTHYIHHRTYLTDALLLAGGLKYSADLQDIRIHRTYPAEQIIHVNLWELFKNGTITNDVPLHDQDTVEVVELPKEHVVSDPDHQAFFKTNISLGQFPVNIIGAVKKPGSYQVKSQDSVLGAIAEAGGLTELADQKGVYILRANSAGQVFKRRVDISDELLKNPQKVSVNQEWASLLPNDVVFVDESASKRVVVGVRNFFDRASGAALLPFFNRLVDF